jgi:hypothetical protein
MKIKLLQNRVKVTLGDEEGYLIETVLDQHLVIGILSDAGVFRPITEAKRYHGFGRAGAFLRVLPQYLEFTEELCVREIMVEQGSGLRAQIHRVEKSCADPAR